MKQSTKLLNYICLSVYIAFCAFSIIFVVYNGVVRGSESGISVKHSGLIYALFAAVGIIACIALIAANRKNKADGIFLGASVIPGLISACTMSVMGGYVLYYHPEKAFANTALRVMYVVFAVWFAANVVYCIRMMVKTSRSSLDAKPMKI
ncbi:MAG: hypothetical protein LUH40_07860 [Clostridiales bacterium]|nr:hypothetical protein [Clostridiales bacterium]